VGQVRKLWIEGPVGKLEAALRVAPAARAAAVLAHPHPLHGGSLHHPVLFHADRELNRAGLATLRFNFRGTGTSEGEHDEGRGEIDDLAHATTWLRGVVPAAPLLLVGYSFGSLCGLRHALDAPDVAALIAIGLPVRLYPMDAVARLSQPLAVVQGSEDEFGSPADVRQAVAPAKHPVRVHVIGGAGHLFPDHAPEVATAVVTAANELLGTFP
jgi:alpha/beta superfamily hydrolase